MSELVVVQARTGSTRFPGKVLADLAGRPMLAFMLVRLAPLLDDADTTLVVATSDRPADDEVATLAAAHHVPTVRGSEQNVLDRFRAAMDAYPSDVVVRLTGDCPLMDPGVVRDVLAHHHGTGADYTSNTLARTFPDGLDVEVIDARALRWASEHAMRADEREHVTPCLQRHPSSFQLAQLLTPLDASGERWTVDTVEDLDDLRRALAEVDDPAGTTWVRLLEAFGRRPTTTDLCARAEPTHHRRGDPFVRSWRLVEPSSDTEVGRAEVAVEDAGVATLAVDAPVALVDTAETLVRRLLSADRQVTALSRRRAVS